MKRKATKGIARAAYLFVTLFVVAGLFLSATAYATEAGGSGGEIVLKGQTGEGSDEFMGDPQDVYWVDAAVQKPDNYTDIVGFKLTAKFVKHDNYGGGKEDDSFRCGMVLATKGAHEPGEYNFTYDNGQTPEFDLSSKTAAAFGVGEAGWLITMVFPNGITCNEDATDGDTVVLEYEGDNALFTKDDSVLTLVSFLGTFEYQSIEWITGSPEIIEEEPWDKVETVKYEDVATVAEDKQNGCNYVDITIPDTDKESYPVIFWIHGGGYITGDRKSCLLSDTKEYLLAQGYAFVSAEYTLTETETDKDGNTVYKKGGMPQMLYDLKAAVRFLRANAAEYKLNTDYIVAMGESAGAGLALLMGTSNGSAEHEDMAMGNEGESSDIQAVVSVCGPTIFTGDYIVNMPAYIGDEINDYKKKKKKAEIDEKAALWSPAELVNSETPPLFLAYSKADTTVPFGHAEALVEAAKTFMDEENITTSFYKEGGHVDRGTFDTYTAYVTVTDFINTHKAKYITEETSGESEEAADIADTEESKAPAENDTEKTSGGLSGGAVAAIVVIVIALVVVVIVVSKKKK